MLQAQSGQPVRKAGLLRQLHIAKGQRAVYLRQLLLLQEIRVFPFQRSHRRPPPLNPQQLCKALGGVRIGKLHIQVQATQLSLPDPEVLC